MDNTQSPASEFKNSRTLQRPEVEAWSSKKRSMAQKVVVTVKLGKGDGRKRKSEGPPSDSWSWRKYGQKPIKGSPHPRGYYRCSSSKGCSAKKQVERSRTDASVLIITYTSTHNHPAAPATTNFREEPAAAEEEEEEEEEESPPEDNPTTPVPEEEEAEMEHRSRVKDDNGYKEDSFHYSQSPFNTSEDMIITPEDKLFNFTETLGTTTAANYDHSSCTGSLLVQLDGEPLCYPHLMDFSSGTPKSQENDFYDELEELPPTSSYPSS